MNENDSTTKRVSIVVVVANNPTKANNKPEPRMIVPVEQGFGIIDWYIVVVVAFVVK